MSEVIRPTRWSYSSVSTYKGCPQKWKFSYIDKLPWPSSAAMARGTRMHSMAEDYVLGKISYIPAEIKKIGPTLEMFKSYNAKPEAVWLLDKDWKHTEDQDAAWVKAIIDLTYTVKDVLFVKDYKSGQMYPDHQYQLELYGLMGLRRHPEVKRVEVSAIYMDTGHEGMEASYIQDMVPKMMAKWEADAQKMMTDEVWEPNPGNACRWCPYSKAKGGPCGY